MNVPNCFPESAATRQEARRAAQRQHVAKGRRENPRIDYAPAVDVLPLIAAWCSTRPDLAKAEVLDMLIRAGHRALSETASKPGPSATPLHSCSKQANNRSTSA